MGADGGFSQQRISISPGDRIRFILSDRTDSVIPAYANAYPAICSAIKPWTPTALAGPKVEAPSGIIALGPDEYGLVEVPAADGRLYGHEATWTSADGQTLLCRQGTRYAALPSTYADPAVTGVFIRIPWKELHIAPGSTPESFDFTVLDREINQAVVNGKVYSLAITAGNKQVPDWVYEPYLFSLPDALLNLPGGRLVGQIPKLRLRDSGSDLDDTSCGFDVHIANPAHPKYGEYYRDIIKSVADHLKTRADWYRALAYFKLAGANMFTAEARLPKRCRPDCVCNTQLFAVNGYTPDGLYAFFREQEKLVAEVFPGKTMSSS